MGVVVIGEKYETLSIHKYILFIFPKGQHCLELSRGEICVANLKAPLRMVRVWTGF